MDEHRRERVMEQTRAHLARADSELEGALRLLDPRTGDEAKLDLVRCIQREDSVAGALETIRGRLGE
jgi:hypothetical protein